MQTNMQMLKLNVKKAEMWAERGILMCVYNGGIARILDFLYPSRMSYVFQEKEKAGRLSGKIEQIQQIQRKRQGEVSMQYGSFVVSLQLWIRIWKKLPIVWNKQRTGAKCTVVRKIRCILPCQRNCTNV